ncbi:MAG: hydantoinase/carbamoylase family amidase [Actinomycetia bacterium]|nr:hydantoinase/carbamoylase family amidase [Actinomycetes bacterium]
MAQRAEVEINGERLLGDLRTLRSFGATGAGVVRPTFSDDDMAARGWLRALMTEAGLSATIDGVGNVVGRSPNPGPALLVGSHSDTQPTGGWLDGALGVIYGIEVARSLREDPSTTGLAIDTVAWSDEEGTYTSCLGSSSFVDALTAAKLQDTNAAGETVAAAIDRVGLTDTPRSQLDPDRHIGYLEAHIEQGPRLEDEGLRVGVVTSIVGIRAARVEFRGEQNHAGTTPMARRRDAGVALFEFAVRLRGRLGAAAGTTTVWTLGRAQLDPGAESIIPGRAELSVQFRDPSDQVLSAFDEIIRSLATEMTEEGPVEVVVSPPRHPIAPTDMDPGLRGHLAASAEHRVPGAWIEMPSAAGHDPMVLAHHVPCGMLFIPSVGGISHDFAEDSTDLDIITGCQVLADAAASILG